MFHSVCGHRISVSNDGKTAKRNLSEYNHGLVFSRDPLQENYLFEVRVDEKVLAWNGGLDIGVTECNPECIVIPPSAMDLGNGTWILAGSSILEGGRSVRDTYGLDVSAVVEGDVIGVMKNDKNELLFSLNGECKGIAASHIPDRVFVVIDLYGQVAQASIVSYAPAEKMRTSLIANDVDTFDDSDITEGISLLSNLVMNFDSQTMSLVVANVEDSIPPARDILTREKIVFHPKCGSLVKISRQGRTAERLRPSDEFNHGVVITHRPLYTGELFEVRIDSLIDKWSGSIEVGITFHNPAFLKFPSTMTNLQSGTIMMSGCGILMNGKAFKRDYGNFNLDCLKVGDRIGLIRKSNGNLRYVVNGLDQGVALCYVPAFFWGVIDLYGRITKVTIVERDEKEEQNNVQSLQSLNGVSDDDDAHALAFHSRCGSHAVVINNNRTARRRNAQVNFNNAVVLTYRPLRVNEPFQVKLDKTVNKWVGSIEIGVTSYSPKDLVFPSTMTNIRSGTWMMTGAGVMHNGNPVLDDYGINLDRLQVGDRVAIIIKDNGSLHLLVNDVDQGEIPTDITCPMYGVIDLYGQVAQVTIVGYNSLSFSVTPSDIGIPRGVLSQKDLKFHELHGKNIRITNDGRTAIRPHTVTEFADAVVLSSQPLRNDEMFSFRIEKIINRWSGSIEAGITALSLEDLKLPPTMTDLNHGTWMLSGSTVMKDGKLLNPGYALNLDAVQVGMIIGMMKQNNSLHYYLNGVDQGEACNNIPSIVYPVVDLYGQCVQVSLVGTEHQSEISSNETSHYQSTSNWAEEIMCLSTDMAMFSRSQKHFSQWCGKNINLTEDFTVASRTASHNHGLVFSDSSLEPDKLYEMTVTKWTGKFAGSLSIGVTTIIPEKTTFPPTISCLKPDVWYVTGDEVWHNGQIIKAHYCHNLHWLQCGSTIGLRVSADRSLHLYINGQDQGIAAYDIPVDVYAVVDLYGSVTEVTVNGEGKDMMTSSWLPSLNMADSIISSSRSTTQDTLAIFKDILRLDDLNAERATMEFYLLKNFEKEKELQRASNDVSMVKEWTFFRELRGRNIRLLNNGRTALRTESYNQGVVILSKPLERNTIFQIIIDNLNQRWVSSLMIGILCSPVTRNVLPVTAFGFKKDAWIIAGDSVYHNGHKVKSRYGPNLESLTVSQKVGIMVDSNNQLKMFVDGVEQGVAAANIPPACFVVLDLYGQCEQVSIRDFELIENSRNDSNEVIDLPSVSRCQNEENVASQVIITGAEMVSCEKADLERHEKESPSDDDSIGAALVKLADSICSKSDDEGSVSRLKLHKTNENIAVVASSYSHVTHSLISQTESHVKLNKTNENNAVIASCSSLTCPESVEFTTKADKTNENNSVVASSSMSELLYSSSSSSSSANAADEALEFDRKSAAASENLTLQQSAENAKHMSTANCDHKTSLNIANAMYIQAEKSGNKSKTMSMMKNNCPSLFNDRPVSLTRQNPNCEYRIRCLRFRNFLGLPAGFFSSDSSVLCYCSACFPAVAQELKGDPPSSFSVPAGWCKFPLKKHLMTNNVDAVTLEKWHVAFVGVSVGNVRRILDTGQLIAPDKLKIGFPSDKQNKLNDDENSKFQIVLSPMIKYATNVLFASKYRYVDQTTKISYTCTAAFQVLVRPASYKVGAPSSKITSKSVDQNYQANSIEWVIKEKESTVLSAVLFKLDPS